MPIVVEWIRRMQKKGEAVKGEPVDALEQLNKEHEARTINRMKAQALIVLVSALILIVGGLGGFLLLMPREPAAAITVWGLAIILAVLWSMAAHLLLEWDRAVVLRLGRFRSVRGPGFFLIVPFVDSVTRVVDMRIRTTAFRSEANLTQDTVPLGLDAIAFWHVWDCKKAVLEVESYYQAIVLAIQTALRDIVGVHTLAEILAERDKIGHRLQEVLSEKVEAWGISVKSIEIRDITLPDSLKDALSKQAQAERERHARVILGQAEMDIAKKFLEAARTYENDPVALQLRAMNIIGEGMLARGSLMLVPSTALDAMNLGGLTAIGLQARPPAPAAAPAP